MHKLNIRNRIFLVISITTLLSVAFIFSGDNSTDLEQSGIKMHWSAVILEGQLDRALKIANEITEYVNKSYPGLNVQAYREVVGEGGKIHWFADFENQEEIDEFEQKSSADAGLNEIRATFEGIFEEPVGVVLQSIY